MREAIGGGALNIDLPIERPHFVEEGKIVLGEVVFVSIESISVEVLHFPYELEPLVGREVGKLLHDKRQRLDFDNAERPTIKPRLSVSIREIVNLVKVLTILAADYVQFVDDKLFDF